jgi:hypothetical protein
MHVELMFPKKYLKAADIQELGRDLVITIGRVALEELTYAGGRKEKKWVIHRKGKTKDGEEPKQFVLNVTNARMIAQVTGETDCDDWPGHKVALYNTTCQGQKGEIVDCIRVRPTKPTNGPPTSRSTGK